MNKCELMAALQAWNMAILHAMTHNHTIDQVEWLAREYGAAISTPENVEAASHLFNWQELAKYIPEDNNGQD